MDSLLSEQSIPLPAALNDSRKDMSSACQDDDTLIRAALQGDPEAFSRLYKRYQALLYSLCYRLLGTDDDAQDAVQAAFVRAFRGLSGYRRDSSLKTWLYRIAVNEAISTLRKRRKAPAELTDRSHAMRLPDASQAVEERLAVNAVLQKMTPDHRIILALRFWEELSYEEIAVVMGLSLSAVKMRIQRARREFQKRYEGASDEKR